MRDLETIDSELRFVALLRKAAAARGPLSACTNRFQLYALSKPLASAQTTPAGQATQTIAGAAIATAGTVGLFSG